MPAPVHRPSRLLYDLTFVPVALVGLQLARFFSPKVERGLLGRHESWSRLADAREELQGCVWFHAASVGEYEQARPVLRALREESESRGQRVPTLQTVFSPSGWDFAQTRNDADHLEYLPFDTRPAMRRMIEWLRPRAVVFLKFDCWPNLIWAAREAEVPVVLLDGTLHRRSYRLRPGARAFFGRLFDCFSAIGAISGDDARRFHVDLDTTVPITVTGDTRTDQVIHRWQSSEDGPLARALGSSGWRYVALGSIWPADEEVVLTAATKSVRLHEGVGLVTCPHEPTDEHLDRLTRALGEAGLPPRRLSELYDPATGEVRVDPASDPSAWRSVLVDTVGVLAEIYRQTSVSYVGGSFSTGVHNVLEPAVTGQPVLFGPRIHNAYEAERLVEHNAGFVVQDADAVARQLSHLLDDDRAREVAGQQARRFVLEQGGATRASLELLLPHVFPPAGADPGADS